MFAADVDGPATSRRIAEWFAEYSNFRSHARRVGRNEARSIGVRITDLESDNLLQDAVLSVHHSCMHTFSMSARAVKIIENHHGRAWVHNYGGVLIPVGPTQPGQPAQPAQPRPSRANRRRTARGR